MNDSKNISKQGNEPKMEGWVSPVYTKSKPVRIDLDVALDNRLVCLRRDSECLEHYKMIRTQIAQQVKARNWNAIMITSALPGEGKTTTAINLALSFAKEFDRTVLLVDCDLRQQKIHEYLGYACDAGLAEAFRDNRSVEELIVWPGIEKLTIISGGETIQDSAEILESPKMKGLVKDIKDRYPDRYVFFDAPPLLSGADAIAFAPLMDAVVMVVEAGKTSIDDIKRAADLIPKEKFLGFILNRQTGRTTTGYGCAS